MCTYTLYYIVYVTCRYDLCIYVLSLTCSFGFSVGIPLLITAQVAQIITALSIPLEQSNCTHSIQLCKIHLNRKRDFQFLRNFIHSGGDSLFRGNFQSWITLNKENAIVTLPSSIVNWPEVVRITGNESRRNGNGSSAGCGVAHCDQSLAGVDFSSLRLSRNRLIKSAQ